MYISPYCQLVLIPPVFNEIWHPKSTVRHNHVCQIFSRSVQGLRSSDTPKIAISNWLAASPFEQCTHWCATLIKRCAEKKSSFWREKKTTTIPIIDSLLPTKNRDYVFQRRVLLCHNQKDSERHANAERGWSAGRIWTLSICRSL